MDFSQQTTTLVIFKKEMEDIKKIAKSLLKFGLLIKRTSETIENQAKGQICEAQRATTFTITEAKSMFQ